MTRVLHLTVHRQGGGTETNVQRLCAAVPEFDHFALESLMGFPLRWWRLPCAIAAIRAKSPDVIFCYGVTAHLVALLANLRNVPLVGNIRSVADFERWKGTIWRFIQKRFVLWISNSQAAIDLLPVLPHRHRVIYNGVPEPPAEESASQRNLRKPVLGMLASGHARKGHRFMMFAWRELGKPGTLIFAGNLGKKLRFEAKREGILCPGFVEPGPLLRSLDLLLIPSEKEGIPTVLPEAMIRGVPCLAAPAGGIGEIIEPGKNGFLLQRSDWPDFLKTLDEEKLRDVGTRARDYALKNASFERMKSEFISAAEEAARLVTAGSS